MAVAAHIAVFAVQGWGSGADRPTPQASWLDVVPGCPAQATIRFAPIDPVVHVVGHGVPNAATRTGIRDGLWPHHARRCRAPGSHFCDPCAVTVRDPGVAGAALTCDFVGGALGHRLRAGIGRREPLPRAVGLKPGYAPRVVDATAGLGRDAIMLAALGIEVTMIERAPAMRALLAEAIAQAMAAGGAAGAAAARLTLLAGDARDHLPGLDPDVVLVDPMHQGRVKSALVKQEMRLVRDLVGDDADALDLMHAARAAARHRVVLKWPLRAASLRGLPPPHHSITSKTLRFDVFMPAAP